MIVVVWALRAGCGRPETGARDQYMPELGAGATWVEVVGEARAGNGLYVPPAECFGVDVAEARWVVDDRVVPLVVERESVEGADGPALLAMADVDRRAGGRAPPADASSLDSGLPSPLCSPFSLGLFTLEDEAAAAFLILTGGGPLEEAFGVEAEDTAAADWARCLIESSDVEGLRLDTWLLEERWPGVWLRGTGGARSGAAVES